MSRYRAESCNETAAAISRRQRKALRGRSEAEILSHTSGRALFPPMTPMVYPGWVPFEGACGFGWGWRHWEFDWHGRRMVFNRTPYIVRSRPVIHGGPAPRRSEGSTAGVWRPWRTCGGGFHGGEYHR